MNREERIERARRMAAEHAPAPEAETMKKANYLAQRLANVGASQAQRHVDAAERAGTTAYLDPAAPSQAWDRAVGIARLVTIARAKRRDTITASEIRWVIYTDLRMLLDDPAFNDLAHAVRSEPEPALLGSIIVDSDSGKPTDDFLLEAMERGFEDPLEILQRQVYGHFR